MAAPVGLNRERVVDAALAAVRDTGDIDTVTLADVAARLGIRTQSLYTYVDGAAGLRRAIGLRGLDALAERLTDAAVGRSGGDAVEGIVRAYLEFAADEPGLYAASLVAPGDDPE